jgi:hypothetical protein
MTVWAAGLFGNRAFFADGAAGLIPAGKFVRVYGTGHLSALGGA